MPRPCLLPLPGGFPARFCLWIALGLLTLLPLWAVTGRAAPPIYAAGVIHGNDLWGGSNPLPIVATGVNASGQVCGYFTVPSMYNDGVHTSVEAFAGGNRLNQALGAENAVATGVNDAGMVAGVCWYDDGHVGQQGFVWQNGQVRTFASPTGGDIDAVTALNDYGQVVGTYYDGGVYGGGDYQRAFLWDGSTCTDLGDLGDPANSFVWPVSVTNDGQVAGTLYDYVTVEGLPVTTAFQWTADGGLSALDADGQWISTTAAAQDANGNIVGGFLTRATRKSSQQTPGGFFWSQGTLTDLGSLGGGDTVPFTIGNGVVAGTSYASDGTLHLFDWQNGASALTDLGSAQLEAGDASFRPGINGDGSSGSVGTVGGFVTDAGGGTHAVVSAGGQLWDLATLVPAYQATFTPDDSQGQGIVFGGSNQVAFSAVDAAGVPEVVVLAAQADTDGDGLPDAWEQQYFHHLGVDPDADPDGDGLTNLQEYEQGTDPTDPFNGQPPVVTALSGTPQTGAPGGLAPLPLLAQVANADGTPLAGATVTFSTGAGQLQVASSGAWASTQAVYSDANGQARVFCQLPNTTGATVTVSASVRSKTRQSGAATFTLSTDDGTGSHGSPFLTLGSTFNADASSTLIWTSFVGGVTGYTVSRSDDQGASWRLLATLAGGSTSYTVAAADQGVVGYSVFRLAPQVSGGSGNSGGGTNNNNSGGGGGAPTADTKDLPPARYAVIDLGLISDVGMPQQINNNGTVLLVNADGAVSRWRQGNLESLGVGAFGNISPPYYYTITDLENPYSAVLDDLDNVAINQRHPVLNPDGSATKFSYYNIQVCPPSGAAYTLNENSVDQSLPMPNAQAWAYGGDGGRFYGADYFSSVDPGDSSDVAVYADGAWWTPPNPQSQGNGGNVQWTPNPPDTRYKSDTTERFVYSSRNGIAVENRVDSNDPEFGYSLGGVPMTDGDGTDYLPVFQNSRGYLLADSNGYFYDSLTLVGNVNGVFSVLDPLPFTGDEVAGFNAAQVAVVDALGNQSQVYAPQVVGNDSIYGGLPFVYEENPLSQTDVEYALNALVGGGEDDASGGGGTPAAVKGGATTNAPNVDAGSGWTLTSVTGINDSGVIIGVGVPNSGNSNGATASDASDTGGSHALLGIPVQFTVTTTDVGAWDGTNLIGYKTVAQASIPAAAAAAAGITGGGIWRDIQSVDRLSFVDDTTLFCGCPWLADTGAYQVAGKPDGKGNLFWPNGDLPSVGTAPGEVAVLANFTETFNSRWFLVLTINGQQKVVQECVTSYTNVAARDYSGGTPQFAQNTIASKTNPLVGASVSGSAPNPATPPAARASTNPVWSAANTYTHTNSNWHANGGNATKYQPAYH